MGVRGLEQLRLLPRVIGKTTGTAGMNGAAVEGTAPHRRGRGCIGQDTAMKSLQSPPAHLRSDKTGLLLLNLDVVSDHPTVIRGQEDVVVLGTVIVAGAHLDEHHFSLEEVSLGAAELHIHCAGQEWGAAAPVRAAAAEPGPVGAGAGAS